MSTNPNEGTQDKQIGEYVYTVRKMGALQGLQVIAKLLNIVGPGVGAFADKKRSSTSTAGVDMPTLDATISAMMTNADLGDHLVYFCKTFSQFSSVAKGDKNVELANVFDQHFAGDYTALAEWLIFCFEVNAGRFFTDLGGKLRDRLSTMRSNSQSRKVPAKAG